MRWLFHEHERFSHCNLFICICKKEVKNWIANEFDSNLSCRNSLFIGDGHPVLERVVQLFDQKVVATAIKFQPLFELYYHRIYQSSLNPKGITLNKDDFFCWDTDIFVHSFDMVRHKHSTYSKFCKNDVQKVHNQNFAKRRTNHLSRL